MKLSVVMPVYNEILTIREIIRRVRAVPIDKQIVIVDDCSKDGTRRVLEGVSGDDVVVLFHDRNRGKGAAIRTAVPHITGDLVVIQDADLEYNPEEFPRLIGYIERDEADVVYGSRFKGTHRSFMFTHYVGNQVLNFMTNLIYNTCLSDMETCYKVMRAPVFRNLDLQANRFDIEPEITAKILRAGHRLLEVPISYVGRDYSEGKKIKWTDGVAAITTLIKWRFAPRPVDNNALLSDLHEHQQWQVSWIKPHLGSRIVQLNAAHGNLSRYLLDSDNVVLTDPDPARIVPLAHRFRYVDHVACEALDIGSPGGPERLRALAPDTVAANDLLATAADPAAVIASLQRVLAPGTRLALIEPAGPGPVDEIDSSLGRLRRLPLEETTRALTAAGFRIVKARTHNRLGASGLALSRKLSSVVPLPLALALYRSLIPLARYLDREDHGKGQSLVIWAERA